MSIGESIRKNKVAIIAGGLIVVVLLLVGTFLISNKIAPISTGWWGATNTSDGIAIRGYDPVAYHTEQVAKAGEARFTHHWQDATWRFSSAENLAAFQTNPAQYAPRYGGVCARAVLAGFTADANPEIWTLHDGKLYLFVDADPMTEWQTAAQSDGVAIGDQNWSER